MVRTHPSMLFDLPSLHLAFLNIQPWSIAIIVPVAGLIFAAAIIITTMYFQNRRQEMWHQTARLALEKGQPLPALPDRTAPSHASSPQEQGWNDLRGGLVLVGTGAGLYLFLGTFLHGLGYLGAIPGLIGVALLITGLVRLIVSPKRSTDASDLPRS